ncbi:MAG: sensor histidine kinase [Chloroflexi bacterium]|nr:sensor histidine kinase [Chloroflexota bacterium]
MEIFRQLRWKLTLSYTLVTVGALLVITLILGGIAFTQIFVPVQYFTPDQMIDAWMNSRMSSTYPMWVQLLSQSPVDTELLNVYLKDPESNINKVPLFRIGALDFSVTAKASIRILIFSPDGILLGTSVPDDPLIGSAIGRLFDPRQVPGLEVPFRAAQAGDTTPKHLYTELVPNQKIVFAAPVFNRAKRYEDQVVGVVVIIFDAIPTEEDIPAYTLSLAIWSLFFFLLGNGLMGALFGSYFAHGLATRFSRLSSTTDLWSEGDFSRYIDDNTGDEISQFAQRLNKMARQLQSLLRRRQDMAVSEERNRLARDLHDSAKQQALAASFELGTALTIYERDPQEAKKHLTEADTLVDSVRRELTNLVDELRPQSMDGEDFSETLKGYGLEWSRRSGIKMNVHMEGSDDVLLPVTRETLFRIAQEALANIARHSAASQADISIDYGKDSVTLVIKDDGRGFNTSAPHSGLGLHSMQERAESLGGSFSVASEPGRGTRIVVALPRSS